MVLLSCTAAPAPEAPAPAPGDTKPVRAGDSEPPIPSRCQDGPTPERIEVAIGGTTITNSGIAVTYKTTSHDNYDDGRTDQLLHLVFQGVTEDGKLTPSALSWLPSAFAKPEWTYLAVNRCVRVIEPGERRVVLELFTPTNR